MKMDLDFIKQYRKSVYTKMYQHALFKKESPALKAKRTKLAKLMAEVEKLSKVVIDQCPHLIENQRYTEQGIENTLGNWTSHHYYQIQCKACGKVLERWDD